MPYLWQRVILVEVAGLAIDKLRIGIDIEQQAKELTGKVLIYNMAPSTESHIENEGERVRITAGYRGLEAVLFDGVIHRVQRKREQMRRVCRIDLTSFAAGANVLGGIAVRSYAGNESVARMVRDLAADVGLGVGPLDAIPTGAAVPNFAWAGSATQALDSLLGRFGLTWYEDAGTLRVNAPGRPQLDLDNVVISPKTGMIGIPERTDEGAKVKTLLNPRHKIGSTVVLESETLSGIWKVVSYHHKGDNWDEGPFETALDLRPVEGLRVV